MGNSNNASLLSFEAPPTKVLESASDALVVVLKVSFVFDDPFWRQGFVLREQVLPSERFQQFSAKRRIAGVAHNVASFQDIWVNVPLAVTKLIRRESKERRLYGSPEWADSDRDVGFRQG